MKTTLTSLRMCMAIGVAAFAATTGQIVSAQSQAPPAAGGQTPTTQAPSTPSTQAPRTSTGQTMTLVGCIQREADYRKSTNAGTGGLANTGVGLGNEFVLVNAMASTATSSINPSTVGTSGSSGTAYELTGSKEGDAGALVGKRVEITGTVKATDSATGGPTASAPLSQDLQLREFEVASVRETTGSCSPAATPR